MLKAAALVLLALLTQVSGASQMATAAQQSTCQLNAPVQHIIYLQFDNVHFTRDNPNVPSDLEQMPHLLNFLTQNGTVLTQHHTPLIAHTAGDIVTAETGLYPDRHGLAVTNSYRYFTPSRQSRTASAFTYWTSPVFDPGPAGSPADNSPNMVGPDGQNAPAPWVAFTRAGCNVGAAGLANTVLENAALDVTTVFGNGSPEAQEATSSADQAAADFVGIAVHCAQGSPACAGGQPDRLPQEPGGYDGFQALFGHKALAAAIAPGGALTDLNGNPIQDSGGRQGFPGFDGLTPAVTLAYLATMQEHGIPVTFGYLSDAHDPHFAPQGTPAYGPGQAEYVAALRQYDAAFDAFFTRLAADGIDASNTLLVVTADEGDHFAGGPPSPPDCDGVTVACSYDRIGQIGVNLSGLMATQAGISTSFAVHADSAPAVYLDGHPAREDASVKSFARGLAGLQVDNPYTGASQQLSQSLAGDAEQRVLHMLTGDPLRTPTLVLFADPNYFGYTAAPDCSRPCVAIQPFSAWNHGDISPDINTTWLGLAGPGVRHNGLDAQTWSDHVDTRPTLLALAGLKDDYTSDGRVLLEAIEVSPTSSPDQRDLLIGLGRYEKRINAPVGELALSTLGASSFALSSADDAVLPQTDAALDDIANRRADLAARMLSQLSSSAPPDAANVAALENEAEALLSSAQALPRAPVSSAQARPRAGQSGP